MKDLLTNPDAWSEIVDGYEIGARPKLTPFSEMAIEWAALDAADRVLDVASGPGTTTVLAARRARSVHAVDFSSAMIDKLREHAAELDNVRADVGDAQQLTFDDEAFTAAFSMFGLIFFADPIAGLRELWRVLEPGGRVFISSWIPAPQSPMMQPMMSAMRHAMPPDPDAPPPEPFAFADPDALAAGLRAGGFVDVEVRAHAPVFEIVSAERYWAESRTNLFVNDIRKRLGDEWPDFEAKVLDHLRMLLRGGERLAMPGLVARGIKPTTT